MSINTKDLEVVGIAGVSQKEYIDEKGVFRRRLTSGCTSGTYLEQRVSIHKARSRQTIKDDHQQYQWLYFRRIMGNHGRLR
jgi:hypothetical protein